VFNYTFFLTSKLHLAQSIASQFVGQVARSLGELLQQCNAVFVCTPNTTHEEVAIKVLEAGKHLFVKDLSP
jgi:predicted dehydrogenase